MSDPVSPPAVARSGPGLVFLVVVVAALAGAAGLFVGRMHSHGPAGPEAGAATQQFQCPMHPEIVQDHPGTCPICGMKLVETANAPRAPRAAGGERTPRFYRSPMDPTQTSPVPAKDSMGMDYVPVYDEPAAGRSEVEGLSAIELDAVQQQLIGLRTAEVDTGPVGGGFRTAARVTVDETRVRRVNVKVGGYVERLFADFTGKHVARGAALFSFFSPEALAAEQEFLVAFEADRTGRLAAAARRKLELWDVPESELRRLERDRQPSRTFTVVSPVEGVVTKKDVVEGARLEAGSMPFELVDLSRVWVLADVYESELRFVTVGTEAELRLSAYPGRISRGRVAFIGPVLDPATRTARARVEFANPAGRLLPDMWGELTLATPSREVVRVPTDALIRDGRSDVVFVAVGAGRFEPRRVEVGEVGREFAEVRAGVTPGERVVTRANFLVDSESRLRATLERLTPNDPVTGVAGTPPTGGPPATPAPSAHAGHGGGP